MNEEEYQLEQRLSDLRKRWSKAKREGDTVLMGIIERRALALKQGTTAYKEMLVQSPKSHSEILKEAEERILRVKQQLTDMGFFEELKRRYPGKLERKRMEKLGIPIRKTVLI